MRRMPSRSASSSAPRLWWRVVKVRPACTAKAPIPLTSPKTAPAIAAIERSRTKALDAWRHQFSQRGDPPEHQGAKQGERCNPGQHDDSCPSWKLTKPSELPPLSLSDRSHRREESRVFDDQ